MTHMTPTQAVAMLTGKRGIANPALGCLGDEDLLALQTLLAAYKAQRVALAGLVGPAAQALDDLGGLLDAEVFEYDHDRAAEVNATLDDLAKWVGKADQALGEDA